MIVIDKNCIKITISAANPEDYAKDLRLSLIDVMKNLSAHASPNTNPDPNGSTYFLLELLEECLEVKDVRGPKTSLESEAFGLKGQD